HARHTKYRAEYYHNPEPRVMGHGRDLFAQTKQGTTFPVEVSLSHYTINEQTFVIAFVIDTTVRKAQEGIVKGQQQELERVAGEIKSMNFELEQKVEDRTKMLREALSDLEKSKEELSLALEKEKELNELKSRFVTVASHEFRTPLSTILSSAYLLNKYNEVTADEKINKHVHRIQEAVAGMQNILEDFLSLGKMEEGLVQTKMEFISAAVFESIIIDLMQAMEGLLTKTQVIHFKNAVAVDVLMDVNLLKNILINLLSNAIKFTNQNGTIAIEACVQDGFLYITVEDNGIGIPAEEQQYLFERFFRARNASNIQGTGLGLHIVGKYLELMNGRISLKSTLNVGTIFSVYIPQ
ncbi:MAG: PAS domain-containing sensor histidine kinase, partial [Gloeobacteraceae cyanobacterium ES-bin-316]|nr:PAS domain-containing sensor histidine kinase [Ferruginibacter sp.]